MPLKENRRANQKGNQHLQHFIDSDFYDTQSVKRAGSITKSKYNRIVGST